MLSTLSQVEAVVDGGIFRRNFALIFSNSTFQVFFRDVLGVWRGLVDSERLEHALGFSAKDSISNEHELLVSIVSFDLVTRLIRSLVFTTTASAVQQHIVHLKGEEVFPDLKILPVASRKAQRDLREIGLAAIEDVEKITVQDLLKKLIVGFPVLEAHLSLLGHDLLLRSRFDEFLLFFVCHHH